MKEVIKNYLGKISAREADIRYQEIKSLQIQYIGNELDTLAQKTFRGGNLKIIKDSGIGFSTFPSLDDIEGAIEIADKNAAVYSTKGYTGLSPVSPSVDEVIPSLKEDPREIELEEKHSLIKNYNEIIMRHPKIQSSRCLYSEGILTQVFGSISGSLIKEERVYTGILLYAIAKDGMNVQFSFRTCGDQRGFETVRGKEKIAEEITKEAVELLKAPPVEGGIYTVILDPELAGVFIHEAFGHLSEADFVAKNERLSNIMQIGRRFGIEELSVVDDATLPLERGSYKYDDEGTLAEKTYLIKDGILSGRLHSRETAYLMKEKPTGNARAIDWNWLPVVRMSNTYIEPRDNTFEELLEGIDRGLYVVGSLGGMTELEMFTFSALKGYIIEKGKIKNMVRDVVLTGNVFETLKNIEMIGNDLKITGGTGGCGKKGQSPLPVSDGSPHIRIKNVVIGGR